MTLGSRLEQDTCARAMASIGAQVTASYGSTETGQVAQISGEQLLAEPNCAGQIDLDVDLETVPDTPQHVSEGGIVRVKSRRMVNGYLDGLKVIPFQGGWFSPGDVGFVDQEGRLFIQGRVDDRLSYFGEKFLATDIESKLAAIHGIEDAFVTVLARKNGERVVVLAVSTLPVDLLRDSVRAVITRMPFDLMPVKEIPRNHMGKIERKRLTAQCAQIIDGEISAREQLKTSGS